MLKPYPVLHRVISGRSANLLAALLACIVFSLPVFAQETNPLAGDARAAYAGGVLFRAQCATCHGADATGIESIEAPDLTRMWSERAYSDRQVFRIIADGIAGTIMPAHDFTDTETWMLVTFLRSVGQTGVQDLPLADATRGEQLFASNCMQCHRVSGATGEGGALGPDLGSVLLENSLAEIITAVRQPETQIRSGFRSVQVTGPENTVTLGVLKNEDAFSFQIIDSTQRLKAFRKSEASLRSLPGSMMPAFNEDQLSETDLLAILNFIQQSAASAR